MEDSDGKIYFVPENYASKSKLVEGDGLKLIILPDGSYIYKQIEPIARKRVLGIVNPDMSVGSGGKNYRIINSSLTYYRVQPGDEASILIPAIGNSEWAALENIIETDDN